MHTQLAIAGLLIIGICAVVAAVSKRQRRTLNSGAKVFTVPVLGIVVGSVLVALALVK